MPSSGNAAVLRFSKMHPDPNASWTPQAVSPTLTTNHPAPAGTSPASVCSSFASSTIGSPLAVGSTLDRLGAAGLETGQAGDRGATRRPELRSRMADTVERQHDLRLSRQSS